MTREEFQQLSVDRAADILWGISERNGNLVEIMDVVRGRRAGASYDSVRRELAAAGRHVSTLELFYTLDGYDAGTIVRELAGVHPHADGLIAELTARRDQLTIDLINAIMADLDRLDSEPFGPLDDDITAAFAEDDADDEQPDLLVEEPPQRGWLRRLLTRR